MKRILVGVNRGGGPEPGYEWSVWILAQARDEAENRLDPVQHRHVVDQMRSLAREKDPTHPMTVSVRAVEEVHELREKGGVLGRTNIRVYFGVDQSNRAIVVLGVIKKETEGQASPAVIRNMHRRRRKYLAGEYGRVTALDKV